jgi:hypothetical protein
MNTKFNKILVASLILSLVFGQFLFSPKAEATSSEVSYYITKSSSGHPLIIPPSSWVSGKTAKDLSDHIGTADLISKWNDTANAWESFTPGPDIGNFDLETGVAYAVSVTENTLVTFENLLDSTATIDMPRTSQAIDQYHFTLPSTWIGKNASELVDQIENSELVSYYDTAEAGWISYTPALAHTDFTLSSSVSYAVQISADTLFDPNLPAPTLDLTPRISYWWGKVNQHTEDGVWKTDPDGTSGANLDKLTYCKKWYPNTVSYEYYGETSEPDWKAAGNTGSYTSVKPVYECVQGKPDLTVESIKYEDSGMLKVNTCNIGQATAKNDNYIIYLYANNSNIYKGSIDLQAGECSESGFNLKLSYPTDDETVDVKVVLDPNNLIDESNENNNTLTETITVNPKNETITDIEVTEISATSAVIRWETPMLTKGHVNYVKQGGTISSIKGKDEIKFRTTHAVVLTNLDQESIYKYSITTYDEQGNVYATESLSSSVLGLHFTTIVPDPTPRISYWYGKVNQHTKDGVWYTDPDGTSGANIDKLTYCKKWYPNTVSIKDYSNTSEPDWKAAGNTGSYTSVKPVYKCVQKATTLQKPDLTFSNPEIYVDHQNPLPGDAVTFTTLSKNMSQYPITGTFYVKWYKDGVEQEACRKSYSNVAANWEDMSDCTVYNIKSATGSESEGIVHMVVKIDPTNSISESNESNNKLVKNIYIGNTSTSKNCTELNNDSTTGQYFDVCKNNNYGFVCFDKHSGQYQGCSKTLGEGCTESNTNAARNISCSVNPTDLDLTPRISYWAGKVNQHTEDGVWKTDPDAVSGANINKLTYCKKWYPKTTSYEYYGKETITDWRHRGNGGSYTSTKRVYKCVQGENVAPLSTPLISKIPTNDDIISNGTYDLYKFSVAADTTGLVGLYKFTFEIENKYTELGLVELSLYQGNLLIDTVDVTSENSIIEMYADLNTPYTIVPAGTLKNFTLKGAVTKYQSGKPYALDVKILGDPGQSYIDPLKASEVDALANNNFIWTDFAIATSSAELSKQWYNGNLIKYLYTTPNSSDDQSDDNNSTTPKNRNEIKKQVKQTRSIAKRLAGRLLLAVERKGRIYYVDNDNYEKYEVTFGNLMNLFRKLALGISNQDLDTIPIDPDSVDDNTDSDGDGFSDRQEVLKGFNPHLKSDPNHPGNDQMKFREQTYNRLKGRILLQAEGNGQIWYVDQDGERWEVTWDNAMNLFRKLSLGINNQDLDEIVEQE